MVIPGVANGEYKVSNLKTAPLIDIIRFSGELGNKIVDLPDGSAVEFEVME